MKIISSILFILLLWAGSLSAATIVVTWDANVETDLAGYGVYDNGVLAGSTGVLAAPTFSILNVTDGVHAITLDAFDATGNRSLKSDAVSITVDTIPCAVPAKPTVTVTGSSVVITWVANTDSPTSYGVYHDGILVGSVLATAPLTYTITSIPDGSHTFALDSVDAAGNRSAKSAVTTISTDVTAPVKPKNVKITWTK